MSMNKVEEFRRYIRVTNIDEIARRYFVMNAFDGALTMLGILVGAFLSGTTDFHVIIAAGMGASIAMGMSGMSGAYMTERAERKRELRELEDAMLLDLDETMHGKAGRFASVFTALVDGVSPALSAFLILSPFILVKYSAIEYWSAYRYSMSITALVLFSLGAYLARISGDSKLFYGGQMVLVGLITAVVIFLIDASPL
ncbi:MAG: hypothetical protein GF416_07335 [Candidatus Altiarchaeales archaeon]|nr:hypothetical protein [Candidatus Altiarchaeales archaeon]MBD3416925.1 hypothetical protein [Candidatus Altiarchaeales archaeon]